MRNKIRQKAAVIMAVIALLICTACSCAEKNRAIHLTEEQADEFLSSRFHVISGIESADLTTEVVGGKSGRAPGPTDTMTYGTVTIAKKQADVYSGEYIWEEWGDDTKEIYADLMEKSGADTSDNWRISKEFTGDVRSAAEDSIILVNYPPLRH